MKEINIDELKKSPLVLCLVVLFTCACVYLVSLDPKGFQEFVGLVLFSMFIFITFWLVQKYMAYRKSRSFLVLNTGSKPSIHSRNTEYHDELKQNTNNAISDLLKSQAFK